MTSSAFVSGWTQYEPLLYQYALRLTRNHTDAEELLQEVGHKAYKYWAQFKEGSNLKAWLFTIMRNSYINVYRKKKYEISVAEYYVPASEHAPPVHGISWNNGEGALAMVDLLGLIDQVAEQFRRPFLMHYEGYSYDEIARELDIPMGTVKSRIHIARKDLQAKITRAHALPIQERN